jgi:hypothetical protein
MKKNLLVSIGIFLINFGNAQVISTSDSLGLPGDNLNLFAVLDLFRDSKTFEDFEKKLNKKDSKTNNLDLNNDGKTDYIKVIDHKEGKTHSIVLQVPINDYEIQDVAVIEIEKDNQNKIKVQIVGNYELYGKDYIIEPKENDTKKQSSKTINPAAKQDNAEVASNTPKTYKTNTDYNNNKTYLSVNYWPMMGYIYAPLYVVYNSPYYWNRYPTYYQPWTPRYWRNYYWHHHNYYKNYHNFYQRTLVYRNQSAHGAYKPHQMSSITVQKNHSQGIYKKNNSTFKKENFNQVNPAYNNPVYKSKRINSNTPRKYNKPVPYTTQNNNKPNRQFKKSNINENKSRENFNQASKQYNGKPRGSNK